MPDGRVGNHIPPAGAGDTDLAEVLRVEVQQTAIADQQGVTMYAPVAVDSVVNPKQIPKREFSWQEAEEIFANQPLIISADIGHSAAEPRYHALGKTDKGRRLHLTFTTRGKRIRIISARAMHKKERAIYEKAE